jgi:LmbE family N-acetylglucosaminyl deacetylase
MPTRLAVIVAHPDDEVLGCGGTIARRAREGHEVHMLILAEGITSRDESRNPANRNTEVTALQSAAKAASTVLGVRSVEFTGLPDNRMDSLDLLDVIKVIEGFIAVRQPQLVFTHHPSDLNIDHQIVSSAVSTACRPLPGSSVSTLLFFEVPSSSEWQTPAAIGTFAPNWFEDITETLPTKLQALGAYASEMRPWPHARSYEAVEALARWRGASVGLKAAEAFVLGRHLLRGRGQ